MDRRNPLRIERLSKGQTAVAVLSNPAPDRKHPANVMGIKLPEEISEEE